LAHQVYLVLYLAGSGPLPYALRSTRRNVSRTTDRILWKTREMTTLGRGRNHGSEYVCINLGGIRGHRPPAPRDLMRATLYGARVWGKKGSRRR
jgi:hypothetical protein